MLALRIAGYQPWVLLPGECLDLVDVLCVVVNHHFDHVLDGHRSLGFMISGSGPEVERQAHQR